MNLHGGALIYSLLGPMLSSQRLCLQGVMVQHRALVKGQMSSSETCPSKYTFHMVASKKGRQTVHKKQNSKTGGGEKKVQRGMEDGLICRESTEIRLY